MKGKKIIISIITLVLALLVTGSLAYSFNEARKLAQSQTAEDRQDAELEAARQKLEAENLRLREIRSKSVLNKVSRTEYEKIKSLLEKTDIFFKNPESDRPEIQLPTKNKIVEDEINARRLKITEILSIWAYNNDNSLETDQKIIDEIKTYLLVIQAYVAQLKNIVGGLSSGASGLTESQIASYRALVTATVAGVEKTIATIKETEKIVTEATETNKKQNEETEKQTEIVKKAETEVKKIEEKINPAPVATTTATSTRPASTTPITTPATGTTTTKKPKAVNVEPATTYRQNPAPFQDTGVDVNVNSPTSPLQDW